VTMAILVVVCVVIARSVCVAGEQVILIQVGGVSLDEIRWAA
jgi:hypothetical protein